VRIGRATEIRAKAKGGPRRSESPGRRPEARRRNGWGGGTAAALLAVLLIFGDALLTVEVHRVSLDTDRMRKRLERLQLELGALESQWASRSSRPELEERASQLGLAVPGQDQVVVLTPAFLDVLGAAGSPGPAELRRALVDNWIRLNPMGIP
jgi:hypothetical protein